MSRRLQILLEERDLGEIRRAADRAGQTVSEWARQAMRAYALEAGSNADPARKLAVIQSAAANEFPTAEIDQMLAEIEAGYGDAKPA